MSELEQLINELSEEDIQYLEETVFNEDGSIISKEKLNELIEYESTMNSQKNAVQYALKINLNSVYVYFKILSTSSFKYQIFRSLNRLTLIFPSFFQRIKVWAEMPNFSFTSLEV